MRSGNAQRKMTMYSARRPTESAWLENVVDLEEAKVPPKQVSQQAFFKFAILWEDQGMFSYPFPTPNKKTKQNGRPWDRFSIPSTIARKPK